MVSQQNGGKTGNRLRWDPRIGMAQVACAKNVIYSQHFFINEASHSIRCAVESESISHYLLEKIYLVNYDEDLGVGIRIGRDNRD